MKSKLIEFHKKNKKNLDENLSRKLIASKSMSDFWNKTNAFDKIEILKLVKSNISIVLYDVYFKCINVMISSFSNKNHLEILNNFKSLVEKNFDQYGSRAKIEKYIKQYNFNNGIENYLLGEGLNGLIIFGLLKDYPDDIYARIHRVVSVCYRRGKEKQIEDIFNKIFFCPFLD